MRSLQLSQLSTADALSHKIEQYTQITAQLECASIGVALHVYPTYMLCKIDQ